MGIAENHEMSLKALSNMKSWKAQLSQLEEYAGEHGLCNIKPKGGTLDNWCSYQRKRYKAGKLSENQIVRLENIGFEWARISRKDLSKARYMTSVSGDLVSTSLPPLPGEAMDEHATPAKAASSNMKSWEARFSQLEEYARKHSTCNIEPKGKPLDNWCKYQRKRYKAGKLSDSQIRRLENLGFKWVIELRHNQWKARLEELRAYKQEQGHCQVPQKGSDHEVSVTWSLTRETRHAQQDTAGVDRQATALLRGK